MATDDDKKPKGYRGAHTGKGGEQRKGTPKRPKISETGTAKVKVDLKPGERQTKMDVDGKPQSRPINQ